MKPKYKRIVVKIGSNVLTRADGTLDVTRMSSLVDQVAQIHKTGVEVILVSSGAVASGRSEIHPKSGELDSVSARQLFSAVGQAKLINRYYDLFRDWHIACGQVLTTKVSVSTETNYLNQQHCMETMLANDVIPIVNENDTVSITELMFTDNDELAGLMTTMMGAEALIILSNVDGIYNGLPGEPGVEVIREIRPQEEDFAQYISEKSSSNGRGGMQTKSRVAREIAASGTEVFIANGKTADILTDLLLTEKEVICTHFKTK
jgi:glutamate 5-kinase